MRSSDQIAIGLITLGASRFAAASLDDNPSFDRSKRAFLDQVISAARTPTQHLDLFDKDYPPWQIIQFIDDFLRRNRSITDLIVYYCGHGILTKRDELLLAMRATVNCKPSDTLSLKALSDECEDHLEGRRVYWILDCCFAGAAVRSIMSAGTSNLVSDAFFSAFPKQGLLPRSGTALLMAAPGSKVAKAFEGEQFTVFTEALIRVLRDGIGGAGDVLSLRDLYAGAESVIKRERSGTAPLPELFPRGYDENSVALTPLFFNRTSTEEFDNAPLTKTETAPSELLSRLLATTTDLDLLRENAGRLALARERYASLYWSIHKNTKDEKKLRAFVSETIGTNESGLAKQRLAKIVWRRVRNERNIIAIEAFMSEFGETSFGAIARAEHDRLRKREMRRSWISRFGLANSASLHFVRQATICSFFLAMVAMLPQMRPLGTDEYYPSIVESLITSVAQGLLIIAVLRGWAQLRWRKAVSVSALYLVSSNAVVALGHLAFQIPVIANDRGGIYGPRAFYLFFVYAPTTELPFIAGSFVALAFVLRARTIKEIDIARFARVFLAIVFARYAIYFFDAIVRKLNLLESAMAIWSEFYHPTLAVPAAAISILIATAQLRKSWFVDSFAIAIAWLCSYYVISYIYVLVFLLAQPSGTAALIEQFFWLLFISPSLGCWITVMIARRELINTLKSFNLANA
jgi:hypothetical protein